MDANSDLFWGTEIVTTNPYLSTVLQAYSTTANLANNLANYKTTALLQPRLDTIDKLVDTPSGISMGMRGDTNLVDTRVACYERDGSLGQTPGQYFYGIGVYSSGGQSGLGLWGSTGVLQPDHGSGSGVLPHLFVKHNGYIAIGGHVAPTEKLHVVGNILCSGSITARSASSAVKSFDIEHPDPEKQNTYRLRHWCVESDVAGGMVMYRKQVTATKASTITLEMPDWFKHLTKNVIVFCSPDEHFGNAWGKYIDNNIIEVHTSKGGKYNVLITCDRADLCATSMCPQEVEYIPENPTINNDGMHPK